MDLLSVAHGLGSIGLFSSRIFLPALLTSLLLRFGPDIPLIHHLGLLNHLHHTEPTWFTNNATIAVLAVLSGLEIFGQKNPEVRTLFHEFDIYLKPGLAALTSFGVIKSGDAHFIQHAAQAGFIDGIIPLLVAIGTWRVSKVRNQVMMEVFAHVEGTHLDHLLGWLEEAWVTFGAFFLVLFPIFMLVLIGIATGVLYVIRRRLRTLEEQSKLACTRCGKPVYPSAMACPACRQPLATPAEVGFLGQSKPYPCADVGSHPYRLIEKRRCAVCASHLTVRKPFAACAACGEASLADAKFVDAYLAYVDDRLPVVLGVCFLLSLVPIFGLIVGAVYYRMELVLPFSQYLPFGRRFVLRWLIRLVFLVLIFVQVVPLLGGLVVPLLAFMNYTAYRSSFAAMTRSPRPHAELGTPVPAT
jgi:hypothetical protein